MRGGSGSINKEIVVEVERAIISKCVLAVATKALPVRTNRKRRRRG